MRQPEGSAHGFVVLTDTAGKPLAHGELIQWAERRAIASRLVFRFSDGSTYDELVRFSQRPVLRLLSYHLVQQGPAFTETCDLAFDRSGAYRVRRRAAPGEKEQQESGSVEIPADVSNGMTSLVLKNLPPGTAATTHLIAFTPKPQILELHLAAEGTDRFFLGSRAETATRFLVQPKVPGVKGVLASAIGKQPPSFRMWMTAEPAPSLVRFEGPLYADGPTWRIGPTAPQWSHEEE